MTQLRDWIARLPDWVSLSPDDWTAQAARVDEEARKVGRALAPFDLGAIRSAIEAFAPPGTQSVEDAGRLLLLNRLVFEVPEWSDASVGFFGGFLGPKTEGDRAEIGWPFDAGGSISHPFRGYAGDEYQAVAEFDRFRDRFPRRRWA